MYAHPVDTDVSTATLEHVGDVAGVGFAAVRDLADFDAPLYVGMVPVYDKVADEHAALGVLGSPGNGVPVDYEFGGVPGLVNRLPYTVGPVTSGERHELRGAHVKFRRRPEHNPGPVTESGMDYSQALAMQGLTDADQTTFQTSLALGE